MSSNPNVSFLSGVNSEYIAHLYSQYLADPDKINGSWQRFFDELNDDEVSILKELHGASWTPEENRKDKNAFDRFAQGTHTSPVDEPLAADDMVRTNTDEDVRQSTLDSIHALMLIRAFRARGHLISDLDPLGLKDIEYHPELDPSHYGFTEADYDRPIFVNGVLGMDMASLREILSSLKETYCGNIGVEFLHLSDPEEKSWIQERIEAPITRRSSAKTASALFCSV